MLLLHWWVKDLLSLKQTQKMSFLTNYIIMIKLGSQVHKMLRRIPKRWCPRGHIFLRWQFVGELKKYHRSGRGLFIWADNVPLFVHANLVLKELFGVQKYFYVVFISQVPIDGKHNSYKDLIFGRWKCQRTICQTSFDNWHCQSARRWHDLLPR